jgi:3-oxoacyl-[acyl-carrier protein] reductase
MRHEPLLVALVNPDHLLDRESYIVREPAMHIDFRLRNKVALITGASRGLGRAMALRFGEERALVAVHFLKNSDLAEEVCNSIVAAGGKAICVQADVAQRSEVDRMVQTVVKELGPIDILVNNAGIGKLSSILETPMEDIDFMVGINLKGPLLCVQAVAAGMKERKYGRILNVSSLAGLGTTLAGTSAYAATKAALITLTKRIAMELGPHNITVNAIAPGFIATDTARQVGILSEAQVLERVADSARRAMLGRVGAPEDIANAALFLVSDEASFITAQTLTADGGRMDLLSYSA